MHRVPGSCVRTTYSEGLEIARQLRSSITHVQPLHPPQHHHHLPVCKRALVPVVARTGGHEALAQPRLMYRAVLAALETGKAQAGGAVIETKQHGVQRT
jgi:hypothetical protein